MDQKKELLRQFSQMREMYYYECLNTFVDESKGELICRKTPETEMQHSPLKKMRNLFKLPKLHTTGKPMTHSTHLVLNYCGPD